MSHMSTIEANNYSTAAFMYTCIMRAVALSDLGASPGPVAAARVRCAPAGALPLPSSLRSAHLLARVSGFDAPAVEDDLAEIDRMARQWANDRLRPAEIDLPKLGRACSRAEARVTSALRNCLTARVGRTIDLPNPDVVACRWAAPHTDDDWSGRLFLSIVAGTGEPPYIAQTLHTRDYRARKGDLAGGVVTTTLRLRRGDCFVLDPTTPHLAVPETSSAGALLVLLQYDLPGRPADLLERLDLEPEDDRLAIG